MPVPGSPVIRAGILTSASFLMVWKTPCMGMLTPTMSEGQRAPDAPRLPDCCSYACRALFSVTLTSSMETGLVK